MLYVIPLAGPDFYHERYGVRPLFEYRGGPLIQKVLESRPWFVSGVQDDKLVFVLRNTFGSDKAQEAIKEFYPRSRVVVLSSLTNGALLSALAAASFVKDYEGPLVVDLADIIFECNDNVIDAFLDSDADGCIPYFVSNNSQFSYLRTHNERVTETKEKEVISDKASAGVYFFKNLSVFLRSVAEALERPKEYQYNEMFFVCPVYNAICKTGGKVIGVEVSNVEEISLVFK